MILFSDKQASCFTLNYVFKLSILKIKKTLTCSSDLASENMSKGCRKN